MVAQAAQRHTVALGSCRLLSQHLPHLRKACETIVETSHKLLASLSASVI